MNDKAGKLMQFMSELSEEAYYAGWMEGLECALWNAVLHGPREYGRLQVTAEHIAQLEHLAQECGGWICFDDKTEGTFIPMVEWQKMFDRKIQHRQKNLK